MSDLVIELMRHMEAVPARRGTGDAGRSLTALGRRQAEMHAEVMAAGDSIVALYASPALRCRLTLEPLARRLGLKVIIETLLAETRLLASLPIGAENPWLAKLNEAHPGGGRLVACSHADTIPAFIGSLGVEPYVANRAVLQGFGEWYRVRTGPTGTAVEHFEAPAGFPTR